MGEQLPSSPWNKPLKAGFGSWFVTREIKKLCTSDAQSKTRHLELLLVLLSEQFRQIDGCVPTTVVVTIRTVEEHDFSRTEQNNTNQKFKFLFQTRFSILAQDIFSVPQEFVRKRREGTKDGANSIARSRFEEEY